MRGDSASSGEGDPQPTSDQIPSQRELEAKIQCASTLLAWSIHRDNAQRLAKVWATTKLVVSAVPRVVAVASRSYCRRRHNKQSQPSRCSLFSSRFTVSQYFSRIMYCGVAIVVSQEGAVEAVLRLCKTDHLILRGYCSAILKQFAATPILREKLVARGGVRKRGPPFESCVPILFSSTEQIVSLARVTHECLLVSSS